MKHVILLVGLWLGVAGLATAQVVVPNANAGVEGDSSITGPFQSTGITFQWAMAASQFGAVPVGSQLTAIGFRTDGGSGVEPIAAQNYASWDLTLSSSVNAIGSLSGTFASNIGGDAVAVRSGGLTVNAFSFAGGPGPNAFTFISFTTPYIYTGGDLLVTLRHTGAPNGFGNDGVLLGSIPGLGDTVLENDFNAVTGTAQFFNMPVTAFQFSAVPEPSVMLITALGGVALVGWRRRQRARRAAKWTAKV